jgi:hypothetical protein
MILTLIETTSIQSFIFGSNDLRENIGASEIVYRATSDWAFVALSNLGGKRLRHNIDEDAGRILPNLRIEKDRLDAEVLFSGGGGLAVLFAGESAETSAKDFIYALSLKFLRDAPGLGLAVAHVAVDFNGDCLRAKKDEAQQLLQYSRANNSGPLLGLGVTVADTSTGWPTIGLTDIDRNTDDTIREGTVIRNRSEAASAQRLAKLGKDIIKRANERLRSYFKKITSPEYDYDLTNELDELGGKPNEENYLAVVHIDGNGMGARRRAIEDKYIARGEAANRAYINNIRNFSERIKQAADRALMEAVNNVATPREAEDGSKRRIFPVRPIVFGGDDVTLVCDGPLGLTLAVDYIEAFEKALVSMDWPDGKPFYATAGVAIVKKHYPFSRAYDLSEELRSSARRRVRHAIRDWNKTHAHAPKEEWEGSAIDWHITAGGLLGDLLDIREREYRVPDGNLTLRPLLVNQPSVDGLRDWDTFKMLWNEFNQQEWKGSRNKRAALREVLRKGPEAVQQFCEVYDYERGLPKINGQGAHGWAEIDGQAVCLHFDALEALDFVKLEVGR